MEDTKGSISCCNISRRTQEIQVLDTRCSKFYHPCNILATGFSSFSPVSVEDSVLKKKKKRNKFYCTEFHLPVIKFQTVKIKMEAWYVKIEICKYWWSKDYFSIENFKILFKIWFIYLKKLNIKFFFILLYESRFRTIYFTIASKYCCSCNVYFYRLTWSISKQSFMVIF